MNAIRLLLIVILLGVLASLTFGQGPTPPAYINKLDATAYMQWAEQFNQYQYDRAKKLATHQDYTVEQSTSMSIISGGNLYRDPYVGSYGLYQSPTAVNSYDSRAERTYQLNRYGGGPVWIFNPYCPPKGSR